MVCNVYEIRGREIPTPSRRLDEIKYNHQLSLVSSLRPTMSTTTDQPQRAREKMNTSMDILYVVEQNISPLKQASALVINLKGILAEMACRVIIYDCEWLCLKDKGREFRRRFPNHINYSKNLSHVYVAFPMVL